MQLKDTCVLVSGGASGLGAACARQFASQGAKVVIADLNEKAGGALASELGSKAQFVLTNVSDEGSVQKAVDTAWSQFGGLHVAISCAGVGFPEKTVNKDGSAHSLKNFSKTIEVNLVGSFNMARIAASSMVTKRPDFKGERGVIINTASVAAFEGQVGQVAYSASKGGIVGMMLPMARDLAGYGIRVVTIAPGIFDTPMLAGLPENVRTALGQMVPYPSRLGRPEEYARLAQHIVENEMINGEVIRIDGAIRMSPR